MNPIIRLAIYLSRTFNLTLQFWLGVTAAIILGVCFLITQLVWIYFGFQSATIFLFTLTSYGIYFFLHWPGILTPNIPDLRVTPKLEDLRNKFSEKRRVVVLADTHSTIEKVAAAGIPNGDILIHAGDFTMHGSLQEARAFNRWLGTLPHQFKIVIAGNHDLCFDFKSYVENINRLKRQSFHGIDPNTIKNEFDLIPKTSKEAHKRILTNATHYLDGSRCEINCNGRIISVFGDGVTPPIPKSAMSAFAREAGERRNRWKKLDEKVDILISHTPPKGILDRIFTGMSVGDEELTKQLEKLGPKAPTFACFGHIHESRGVHFGLNTTFINAASVNLNYKLREGIGTAVVFDV
eukprot:g3188.t1